MPYWRDKQFEVYPVTLCCSYLRQWEPAFWKRTKINTQNKGIFCLNCLLALIIKNKKNRDKTIIFWPKVLKFYVVSNSLIKTCFWHFKKFRFYYSWLVLKKSNKIWLLMKWYFRHEYTLVSVLMTLYYKFRCFWIMIDFKKPYLLMSIFRFVWKKIDHKCIL